MRGKTLALAAVVTLVVLSAGAGIAAANASALDDSTVGYGVGATAGDTVGVSTANTAPTVANNTGSAVQRNGTDPIVGRELAATDSEQDASNLTYTIDTDVSEGQLYNTDTATQLDKGDTFTQADVDSGHIEYRHGGASTSDDSFAFTVDDGQGGSTSGTFEIVVSQVPYGSGAALALDGSDDYVNTSTGGDVLGLENESFSVGVWFKPDTIPGSGDHTLVGMDGGSVNETLHLSLEPNESEPGGDVKFGFFGNDLVASSVVSTGSWQHLTFVYNASAPDGTNDRFIYHDGALVAADESPGDFKGTADVLVGRWGGSNYFDGRIDQVRIWTGPLSGAEIRERSRRTIDVSSSVALDLEAAYRFDNTTAGSAQEVIRDRDGTLTNGAGYTSFSGAGLGQTSAALRSGSATVGPAGGTVTVENVATSGDDALQVYQYGQTTGPTRNGTDPGENFSQTSATKRLHVVWGLEAVGTSPSADVTIDYSGVQGLGDPDDVRLLKRSGPGEPWQDVSLDWTWDEANRTFSRNGVSGFSQYAIGEANTPLIYYYAGGSGTESNPYRIADWGHLANVSANLGANFTLANDLNESTAGYDDVANTTANGGKGFLPLGNSTTPFTGTFDGNDSTITGLFVNRSRSSDNGTGLFGRTGSGALLENVRLENASVTNPSSDSTAGSVGGLVGYNTGTVNASSATGTVSASSDFVGGVVGLNTGTVRESSATVNVSGDTNVGGLVGDNQGAVNASSATGNVSGSSAVGGLVGNSFGGTVNDSYATGNVSGSSEVGGLVGINDGTLTSSYATGNVSGTGVEVGGLVADNSGTVRESYATGTVSGGDDAGGFVGTNTGTVNDSYATASVSGGDRVGGFVGDNLGGTVNASYATGNVSGTSNVGGFVGNDTGTVNASYWDLNTTGQATSDGGTGLRTDEMLGDTAKTNMSGFDFTTNWTVFDNGTYVSYPYLRSNAQTPAPGLQTVLDGNGTASDPFRIADWYDLNVTRFGLDANYTLVNDLNATTAGYDDVASSTANGGKGFVPIGNSTTMFNGTFDGNDSTITDLFINRSRPGSDGTGLFGRTGPGSLVENVGLENASVSNPSNGAVGSLVGWNDGGTVNASYATGAVSTPDQSVGGLVGVNFKTGTVNSSYAMVDVSAGADKYIGGLVGFNDNEGTVTSSYATGDVSAASTGSESVGGLVGISYGTVQESYASGNVTGDNRVGGLVGYNPTGAVVTSSNASGTVSGKFKIGGLVGQNSETVTSSNATGNVSGSGNPVGGLVGENYGGMVNSSYATGTVTGGDEVGGLVGKNLADNEKPMIQESYATGNVSGDGKVGGLVGDNDGGTVGESYATGNVSGNLNVGGFAGGNTGTLANGSASGTVTAPSDVGGAVGDNRGTVRNLSASGTVTATTTGDAAAGGLVGINDGGTVADSRASGTVNSSGNIVGGLVGNNTGTVNTSYATGNVSGNAGVGGLVGRNTATVNASYATGNVSGSIRVGGLVGDNDGTVRESYATGDVDGSSNSVGGLVGYNNAGETVTDSYATGNVSGDFEVGGLVGINLGGTVNASYATGNVSGDEEVGGLVGNNRGTVTDSYAMGSATSTIAAGGLVGNNDGGTVNESYATGTVTGSSNVGGLVGGNTGTVTDSYWDVTTTGQSASAGGTGLTTAEMTGLAAKTNMTGFDFATTWTAPPGDYPLLVAAADGPVFRLTVDGPAEVPEAYPATYALRVDNAGTRPDTQSITLTVDGTVVDSETVTLASGDNRTLNLTWEPTSGDAGSYAPTITSANDSERRALTVGPETDPSRIVRTTEADGTIEVVFERTVVQATTANTGASSGTGDQLNENNFSVTVNGTTYGADADFDVGYSSGTDPNGAGEDVTFTLVPNGTWGDLRSDQNVTVAIDTVKADDDTGTFFRPGTLDVAVTDRVVTGGGPNDTQASAEIVYRGEFVALQGSPGESIGVELVGGTTLFVTNFGNATVRTVNTSTTDYTLGETYEAQYGTSTDQFFNVTTPATARDDAYVTNESTTLSVGDRASGVLGNDTIGEDATLSATLLSGPTNGTLNFYANGTFTYTPDPGFSATDSFTYRAAADGSSDTATVRIYVSEFVDVAPGDLPGDGTAGNPYVITNASELQAIEDDPGANYTLGNDIAAGGTAQWNLGKGFAPIRTYPNLFSGTLDGAGHAIENLTIDRPGESSVGLFGIVGADGTIRNLTLSNASVTAASGVGALVWNNTGTVANVSGHGTVTADGFGFAGGLVGRNDGGTVRDAEFGGHVTGGEVVGGLVAVNAYLGEIRRSHASATVTADVERGGGLVGTIGSFRGGTVVRSYATGNVTGGNRTGGLVGVVGNGTVEEVYATGSVTGDNAVGGLIGSTAIEATVADAYWDVQASNLKVSDGGVGLTTSEMTGDDAPGNMTGFDFGGAWATVTNPDDYPVLARQASVPTAENDSYTTAKDTSLSVSAPGVLGNDSDPDGDSLSASVVEKPDHGVLDLDPDGSFTYAPDTGFAGTDTFVYAAEADTIGDTATVTITVTDGTPTAVNDSYATPENTSLSVSAPGVLGNDSDPDGDSLSAAVSTGPTDGALSLASNGSFTYTPDPGFSGTDSFVYSASDGTTADTATVTVTINGAPDAADDSYRIREDTTRVVPAPGVLGNDSDPDGDSLTPDVTDYPSHGLVQLYDNGSIAYAPDSGYLGADSFTYTVDDGVSTDTATVALSVRRPLPRAWAASTPGGVQYSSPAVGPERVFAGNLDDTLLAVYRANGSVAWQFDRSGSLVDSSPAYESGTVYVGSGGGVLYALDASTGTEQWTYSTDSAIVSSPVVDNGTVYVGSNDGTVLAVDAASGSEVWTAEAGAAVFSRPAVGSGSVFVTADDGRLLALDATDGSKQWSRTVGSDLGHTAPVYGSGTVYVAAEEVYAVDAAGGSVSWSRAYGGQTAASPVLANGSVYVTAANGSVTARDPATGAVDWRYDVGPAVRGTPAVTDLGVVVPASDGRVIVVNATRGEAVANGSLPAGTRSSPAVAGATVYVGAGEQVLALENLNGETVQSSAATLPGTTNATDGSGSDDDARSDSRSENDGGSGDEGRSDGEDRSRGRGDDGGQGDRGRGR